MPGRKPVNRYGRQEGTYDIYSSPVPGGERGGRKREELPVLCFGSTMFTENSTDYAIVNLYRPSASRTSVELSNKPRQFQTSAIEPGVESNPTLVKVN